MDSQKNVIYTVRYTSAAQELCGLEAEYCPTAEDKATSADIVDRFMKHRKKSVFVKREGAERGDEEFVELAKELAETYETDADIIEKEYFIEAVFYLPFSEYPPDFTRILSSLLSLCDEFAVRPPLSGHDGAALVFARHTHDFFLAGKLMNG